MRIKWIISFIPALFLGACTPRISTTISRFYEPLDFQHEVIVFEMQESVPANFEELAIIKIGDTGFSTDCGWETVITKAKTEARKIGGNAIKITDHHPPDFSSTCDRITAKIIRIDTSNYIKTLVKEDSTLLNGDFAILNIYRPSGPGILVNFDLHLGDSTICRVSNRWKTTVKIKKDGMNVLWARTEMKEEIPINIQFGRNYYIRCSLGMGVFVGHPKLQLVDNQMGKREFDVIK